MYIPQDLECTFTSQYFLNRKLWQLHKARRGTTSKFSRRSSSPYDCGQIMWRKIWTGFAYWCIKGLPGMCLPKFGGVTNLKNVFFNLWNFFLHFAEKFDVGYLDMMGCHECCYIYLVTYWLHFVTANTWTPWKGRLIIHLIEGYPLLLFSYWQAKKVVDYSLDKCPVHGLGRGKSVNWWKGLADQLIVLGTLPLSAFYALLGVRTCSLQYLIPSKTIITLELLSACGSVVRVEAVCWQLVISQFSTY